MNSETGFLLIHGFGGNIGELEPLSKYLESSGYLVISTELKGHTGNRKDLAGVSHDDWIFSAEESYEKLAAECDSVIIVGFSTGGLIAVNLAIRHQVKALITVATPIYVWDIKHVLRNMTKGTKHQNLENLKWYFYSATSFPPSSLFHFQILLHKTKSMLKHIKCPILILQGIDDDTVNSRSASYIYNNVSSEIKKIYFFEKSGHIVFKGASSEEAICKIEEFLHMELI